MARYNCTSLNLDLVDMNQTLATHGFNGSMFASGRNGYVGLDLEGADGKILYGIATGTAFECHNAAVEFYATELARIAKNYKEQLDIYEAEHYNNQQQVID